jgi:hypothetical protein
MLPSMHHMGMCLMPCNNMNSVQHAAPDHLRLLPYRCYLSPQSHGRPGRRRLEIDCRLCMCWSTCGLAVAVVPWSPIQSDKPDRIVSAGLPGKDLAKAPTQVVARS